MKMEPSSSARQTGITAGAGHEREFISIKAYKKLIFNGPQTSSVSTDNLEGSQRHSRLRCVHPGRLSLQLEEIVTVLRDHDMKVMLVTLPTVVDAGMTLNEIRRPGVFFPYFGARTMCQVSLYLSPRF